MKLHIRYVVGIACLRKPSGLDIIGGHPTALPAEIVQRSSHDLRQRPPGEAQGPMIRTTISSYAVQVILKVFPDCRQVMHRVNPNCPKLFSIANSRFHQNVRRAICSGGKYRFALRFQMNSLARTSDRYPRHGKTINRELLHAPPNQQRKVLTMPNRMDEGAITAAPTTVLLRDIVNADTLQLRPIEVRVFSELQASCPLQRTCVKIRSVVSAYRRTARLRFRDIRTLARACYARRI